MRCKKAKVAKVKKKFRLYSVLGLGKPFSENVDFSTPATFPNFTFFSDFRTLLLPLPMLEVVALVEESNAKEEAF